MNGWTMVAERQYGVITRAQLRDDGLSDRQIHTLVASERLARMHTGVFRVAGAYRSARQRAMGAVLHCGGDALLSHATAAELFRLPVKPDGIHVSVPPAIKRRSEAIALHRAETIQQRDRFQVDGLPVTSPTRTIIDLAASLDGETLEHTFDRARQMGLVTKTGVERRVSELRCSSALRELLHVVGSRPTESKLEVKVARLLRAHGIKPEALQHPVERFRLDFAWLTILVAVECDGFEWHGNRLAWKRDRRRVARLEALGWRIVHVTWDDVTQRPDETISRIRPVIAERMN